MNRGRFSTQVFLCFLMMFLMLIGCSKSDNTPAPPSANDSTVVGQATITGQVSGTTVVAINESNVEVARMTATGNPKTFTLTLPITSPTPHVYRFYLIENEGTLDQQIYPLYVGAINAFAIASDSTNNESIINLGFVDTTTIEGVATPTNSPLSFTGVSSGGTNTNFPDTLFITTPAAGASLSSLVTNGLTSLQSGNILQANAYFYAAVTNYPTDTTSNADTANFFYAVTSVAGVNLYSDGTPGDFNSVSDILDNVGCSQGGRGFDSSTMTCPKTLPTTTPTGSQLQTFAYNVIAPKLQNALTYLNKVPNTFTISWTNPIDSTLYKSDYADVLIYKAAIEAALAAINIQYAYNLDADIATVHNSNYTVQQFISTYTSFLGLNSSTYLSIAKTYLSPTTGVDDPFDNLIAAINKIQARSTTGYLINLQNVSGTDISKAKSELALAKASLSGSTDVYEGKDGISGDADDVYINMVPFFAGLNLRSLLPSFTGNKVSSLFPDSTMGGVNVTGSFINDDLNGNHIPDILEH